MRTVLLIGIREDSWNFLIVEKPGRTAAHREKSSVFCRKASPDAKQLSFTIDRLQLTKLLRPANHCMNQPNTEITGKLTLRRSRDALLQRTVDEPDLAWRVLTTLNVFRILIASVLLVLFFASGEPFLFGDRLPAMFTATASAYLVFAVFFGLAIRQRWSDFNYQAVSQLLVDVAAVSMLMYASGGISSGLGGLLLVFIGAGSLMLPAQISLIVAAVATFGILGEEVFAQLSGFPTNYPAAGLLSAIIFAMALAAAPLARRMEMSEALARQRGVDLKNLSELNQYIVQHLRESIVVIDSQDNVRLNNGSAAKLMAAEGPVSGRPLAETSEQLAEYIARWRADAGLTSHPEITLFKNDDSTRITAHLAPLGQGGGRDGPALVFLEDASLMNARVQQSKLASLGRLSASIAHEIRNPVGAMSHAAQLLAESEVLTEDDKRLTDIIQTHSGRVSHIIDNVLQLSRRESSRPERLDLKPWLQDFAQEFTRTLELQEGELSVTDVPDHIAVRMDHGHLRQVLWNLCDNAVKYASETGGILVELHGGPERGAGRPFLEVRDHGLGVDPATAEKIFEPFYTERSGGTGLGLYISRELCELNRATLLYLDRPGGGSIFRIVFADPDRWEP
jgi:two-component system sensor histidine kinase PilS (NtrC family)